MMANTDSRRLLIKSLEDIYALEAHLVQELGDHAKDAQNDPLIRQKIEQHLRETELHRDRIEQRLNVLGGSKPGFKAAVANVIGQVMSVTGGSHTTPLVKYLCEEYASEQLEIACYVELITLAQTLGDVDTMRTAQLNLRDELAMQQWLIQHLPEATLKGLQQEGVQVPASALPVAQSVFADLGVSGFGAQPPFGAPPPYQGTAQQTPPPVIS